MSEEFSVSEMTVKVLADCVERMRRWRLYDEVDYGLHKDIGILQAKAEHVESYVGKCYIYAKCIQLVTDALETIEYGERED